MADRWTAKLAATAIGVFIAAGVCEIGGGYLVWRALRGGTSKVERKAALIIGGILVLGAYGVVQTLQPPVSGGFGRCAEPRAKARLARRCSSIDRRVSERCRRYCSRVYAVYGGFFIVMSYLWAWALEGERPDVGDAVGAAIAVGGVLVALFWPRKHGSSSSPPSTSASSHGSAPG